MEFFDSKQTLFDTRRPLLDLQIQSRLAIDEFCQFLWFSASYRIPVGIKQKHGLDCRMPIRRYQFFGNKMQAKILLDLFLPSFVDFTIP